MMSDVIQLYMLKFPLCTKKKAHRKSCGCIYTKTSQLQFKPNLRWEKPPDRQHWNGVSGIWIMRAFSKNITRPTQDFPVTGFRAPTLQKVTCRLLLHIMAWIGLNIKSCPLRYCGVHYLEPAEIFLYLGYCSLLSNCILNKYISKIY